MSEHSRSKAITTALVADDHGIARFGIAQFLRTQLGVRSVLEAPRFGDALDLLQSQKIDLALFDVHMPGLSSARDFAQVREHWPDVKVVVLSGSDSRANILDALHAGVHGYIIKTETMEDLAERLGYIMSGEIYVPPSLATLPPGQTASEPVDAAAERRQVPPRLTSRQQQVLKAIVKGQSNKLIAKELDLAVGTVKMHVSAVLTALGAETRLQAASLGRKWVD